jgi:hypothetical protein
MMVEKWRLYYLIHYFCLIAAAQVVGAGIADKHAEVLDQFLQYSKNQVNKYI